MWKLAQLMFNGQYLIGIYLQLIDLHPPIPTKRKKNNKKKRQALLINVRMEKAKKRTNLSAQKLMFLYD